MPNSDLPFTQRGIRVLESGHVVLVANGAKLLSGTGISRIRLALPCSEIKITKPPASKIIRTFRSRMINKRLHIPAAFSSCRRVKSNRVGFIVGSEVRVGKRGGQSIENQTTDVSSIELLGQSVSFGAYAKLRRATIGFVASVCPSAR